MAGDVEHETKNNDITHLMMDSNAIRQLKNTVEVFNIIRDLSSMLPDPLKKAMEERIQRSIIENIESFGKANKEESKSHEDISIYEKLSPGDVYILRIVNGELEVIENHSGDIIYKRVTLSIDKLL